MSVWPVSSKLKFQRVKWYNLLFFKPISEFNLQGYWVQWFRA